MKERESPLLPPPNNSPSNRGQNQRLIVNVECMREGEFAKCAFGGYWRPAGWQAPLLRPPDCAKNGAKSSVICGQLSTAIIDSVGGGVFVLFLSYLDSPFERTLSFRAFASGSQPDSPICPHNIDTSTRAR